jgi:ribosomal protein S6
MLYELLYIVSATFTDDDIGKVEATVKAFLEKYGASVVETKRLGKFRFAYPIKKSRHGHYILVMLQAEPSQVAKLDEALRISHEVLRHLILRADETGGSKFDLVQFTEVSTDAKEEQQRRRRDKEQPPSESEKVKSGDEIKSGVEVLEQGSEVEKEKAPAFSAEELEKKLEDALTEKT